MRALITAILCLAVSLAAEAADEKTTYHKPIDKKDYEANWQTYTADPPGTPAPKGKVEMGPVRLLSEQQLFERNSSAEKLVSFIKAMMDRVSAAVPKTVHGSELLVQVTLTARARPKIEMASKGGPPKKLLEAISDSLAKAPDLRSKKDPLLFQVEFIIHDKF